MQKFSLKACWEFCIDRQCYYPTTISQQSRLDKISRKPQNKEIVENCGDMLNEEKTMHSTIVFFILLCTSNFNSLQIHSCAK